MCRCDCEDGSGHYDQSKLDSHVSTMIRSLRDRFQLAVR